MKEWKQLNMARLILLVGACSAGKSSTAKALQNLMDEPNIHLGIDTFHLAIPTDKLELSKPDKDYLYPRQYQENEHTMTEIVHGDIIKRINLARYESVCCFLNHGISVVADEIFWRFDDFKVFLEKLQKYEVVMVAMRVSDAVGESRAQKRMEQSQNYQDDFRPIGMSRASNHMTHEYTRYDIDINTDNKTPDECAQLIYHELQAMTHFSAFKALCQQYLY